MLSLSYSLTFRDLLLPLRDYLRSREDRPYFDFILKTWLLETLTTPDKLLER